MLLERAMRKTFLGVHNFVLGCHLRIRYSPAMSSAAAAPALASEFSWKSAPGLYELMALAIVTAALFLGTVSHFRSYQSVVLDCGDSGAYIDTASAIRHWNFSGVRTKQFWGYSYVMAAVSAVTSAPEGVSLLLVSCLCSACASVLTLRLWGGWIAALFTIANFEWLQRSYLGGSEPLFVFLLFASFAAARKQRWLLASAFASCATVTRPTGFLALLAIAIVLCLRKEYKKVLYCVAVSLPIGAAYLAPFWIYFGDPLYQVHRYQTADWQSASPINVPFIAIASSVVHNTQPWTNLALTLSWILLVLLGAIAMVRKSFWPQLREHPAEFVFALLYIAFLFSYNSPQWAQADFVRFAIPVFPLVLVPLADWIPQDRRLLWCLGVVSPVLAGASALGIRNVIHALHG